MMESLMLVNDSHPLAEEVKECELSDFHGVLLRTDVIPSLNRLLASIHGEVDIVAVSGYRSHAEQIALYENSLVENGKAFTEQFVAKPGCSEHETGLAIDLGLKKDVIDFIRPDFPYDGICQKFREMAPYYGWIQRYTKEKQSLTHIAEEPWHFRYVGYPHARIMDKMGWCLEEYIEYLCVRTSAEHPLYYRDDYHKYEIYCTDEKEECSLSTNGAGYVHVKQFSYEACGGY